MSSVEQVYAHAARYLSFRPRSVKETRDHLLKKGYMQADVEAVIGKLTKQKFLDDQTFATSWIESRNLHKPTSLRKLTMELEQKGLERETIEKVLDESVNEAETIKRLAKKKLSLAKYQDQRKLTDYLVQQGFRYEDVKSALNEL